MKRITIIALPLCALLVSVASSQSLSFSNHQKDLDSILIAPVDWESLKKLEMIQDDCDFKKESGSCDSAFPKPQTSYEARGMVVADHCNKTVKVLAAYKPCYPPLAQKAKVSGVVEVIVVVDEAGFVTWAHPYEGHPLLRAAAVKAACKWRFEPATCSTGIEKVNRMISFGFGEQSSQSVFGLPVPPNKRLERTRR
jgi:TonB family protein